MDIRRLFDPAVFDKYPDSMRRLVGNRLPEFTLEQATDLIGSFDFIGMNYYTANSIENSPPTRITFYNPESQAICHSKSIYSLKN